MKSEAVKNGYDDAIALNDSGQVCESTVSNFFLVRKGTLITPATTSDILEGITRDSIITLAERLNIPIQIRTVDRTELYLADEAFVCGSSVRLTPVIAIDKRTIGTGTIGPITAKIAEAYTAARTGTDPQTVDWRTSIK